MTYLSCQNLTIQYGYKPLVTNASLLLNSGQKIALTGSNGSGKTSFLRILAGLSAPQKGEVTCFQEQIWPRRQTTKEHLCVFLGHEPALLLHHCVLWNLEYYCRSFSIQKSEEEYIEALRIVGLLDKPFIETQKLSTGQKRRLTFAALLLIQPNIILADEPTNGLDTQGVQLCLNIFDELCARNKSALLVATHDQNLISWCHSKINLEQFSSHLVKSKKYVEELI